MKISYNWLQQFLQHPISTTELSTILTSIGLEVESMNHFSTIKSDLNHCVVGEILACEKHPNADKLKITQVNIGNDKPIQIICGASNVAIGQKVMVALVGASLTTFSNDSIIIKKAKIRGEESEGMICAEDEIGWTNNHDGIKILEHNAIPGTHLANYLQVYEDTIYEIGLTPNRMDAMSHFGVARDVIAYLNYHHNTTLSLSPLAENNLQINTQNNPIEVVIQNEQHCKKYCGIYLEGIQVEDSPLWLKNYLTAIGVKSINNVVDITNYILHSYGQPLHAFDADAIEKKKVVVGNVANGTPFVALDKTEKKLHDTDLIILDGNQQPMCIAGVFGGWHSGIKDTTKNIFLEAAVFDSVVIRKTSFVHQLRTEAALRFEKGIDHSNTLPVLKIAAALLVKYAKANIVGNFIDLQKTIVPKKEISSTYSFIQQLSGKEYTKKTIDTILTSLQFEFTQHNETHFTVAVPHHKLDIDNGNDLVEEIMRIDGIDNIPIASHILMSVNANANTKSIDKKEHIANYLVALGYTEIFTNSILSSQHIHQDHLTNSVRLLNSLSEHLDLLSPNSLYNGLPSIAHNINRKQHDLCFFEFNTTYSNTEKQYNETPVLSIWITGKKQQKTWRSAEEKFTLYDIKSIVTSIFQKLNIKPTFSVPLKNIVLENGFSIFVNDKHVGNLGYVKSQITQQYGIQASVLFAELFWQDIIKTSLKTNILFKEIPKSLPVMRDLSLVVNKTVLFSAIEKTIQNTQINILKNYSVFDIFENEKIGADKKAIAISFEFLDEQIQLTDTIIDAEMKRLIAAFENNHQALIRQ